MAAIVYLAHRMPYPPDKGDKITTFNYLRHLSRNHEVFVGAFVDDPLDWEHQAKFRELCAEAKLIGIDPRWRKLVSLTAGFRNEPLTAAYYRSQALARWVATTVARTGSKHLLVYCSAMAPYFANSAYAGCRRVAQFGDVDSDKWRLYSERARAPMRQIYARESRTLLAFERNQSAAYDVTAFAAEGDAALYRKLAPEVAHKVEVVLNGVDVEYFDPIHSGESPYPAETRAMVFTGVMDYWANVDAVTWFADSVFPRILERDPHASFWIVGSRPTHAVLALGERPGIKVTGRVPDVRPYLAHARLAVAPLRIARGIQNKVLEAMAMGKFVALTAAGAGGLTRTALVDSMIHDEPGSMANAILARLPNRALVPSSREYVIEHNSWAASLAGLDRLLQI